MKIVIGLALYVGVLLTSSCVMERTVTDSHGNVIYQEPEVHTPFESDEKKRKEVMEKERALGW